LVTVTLTVTSLLQKSQKRENRRSGIEAQDGSSVPALNAFGHLVSAEDVSFSGTSFYEQIGALLNSWKVQGTASSNVQ